MARFDRFASWAARTVAQPWFFTFCVLMVLIWGPSYFVLKDLDTWQLVINTATTIVTFLLVALLHNDQQRYEDASNLRWRTLFAHHGIPDPVADPAQKPDEGGA